MLTDAGVPQRLAYHIAALFVRDPMVIFDNAIELDDETRSDHFENLQSTNWNSMRFKPPPSTDSNIGWRVEFRSLDIQLTDFENAALAVLVSMLVNVVNYYGVDYIMPISKVDENFERAHKRGAATEEKFWFKKNIFSGGVIRKRTKIDGFLVFE